jgi:hypothetical protein
LAPTADNRIAGHRHGSAPADDGPRRVGDESIGEEGAVFKLEDLPYNRLAGKKGIERFGTIRVTT